MEDIHSQNRKDDSHLKINYRVFLATLFTQRPLQNCPTRPQRIKNGQHLPF